MRRDESLMVGYAAKKLLLPTAGFLASCPPGVAAIFSLPPVLPWVGGSYYQTQSHHSTLLTNAEINRGKRQKVSERILHCSPHTLQ